MSKVNVLNAHEDEWDNSSLMVNINGKKVENPYKAFIIFSKQLEVLKRDYESSSMVPKKVVLEFNEEKDIVKPIKITREYSALEVKDDIYHISIKTNVEYSDNIEETTESVFTGSLRALPVDIMYSVGLITRIAKKTV